MQPIAYMNSISNTVSTIQGVRDLEEPILADFRKLTQ